MNNFLAVFYNETEKIIRRKKAVVFLVLAALIPLGTAALFNLIQSRLGIFTVSPAGFSMLILSLFAHLLLPLFIFSASADSFAGELEDRTLKITLMQPVSRLKIFLGKNAAIGLFSGILLLTVFLFSMIAGLFLTGGANLLRILPQAALAYLVTIFPMLVLGITASLLTQFFKHSSGALLANIFLYLVGKGLPFLAPAAGRLTYFYYTGWYVMWLGETAGAARLFQVFIIFAAYSIMFLGAGFYFFDRRDL